MVVVLVVVVVAVVVADFLVSMLTHSAGRAGWIKRKTKNPQGERKRKRAKRESERGWRDRWEKNGRIETARGTDVAAAVIVLLLAVYIIHVRAGNISTGERETTLLTRCRYRHLHISRSPVALSHFPPFSPPLPATTTFLMVLVRFCAREY